MVHDLLNHSANYSFPNKRIERGLEFLRSPAASEMAVGRVELEGDQLFALCQEYSTRGEAECFWEAHRKYIDIQLISRGVEVIGYAPLAGMKVIQPYDEEKDFMKLDGAGSDLILSDGMFAVFFPHDAHRPCVAPGGVRGPVRKIVVKVGIN